MIDIDELIEKADAAFDATEPVTQDVLLGDKVVGVRFWPIRGTEWRDLCAAHPPIAKAHANYGFNPDAVVLAYPKLAIVDGDDVDNLIRRDEKGAEVSRWPDMHARLSGADLKNLAIALWGLHEWTPQQRLIAADRP